EDDSGEELPAALINSNFVVIVALATVVLFLLGSVSNGVIGGILLGVLAPIGARILLSQRATRRRTKFADQVDETLGLISGALRSGHGLNRAVDLAAQELESPMRDELARAVARARLGQDLSDALDEIADRTENKDFSWFAQAVAINRDVGGNLAEVLDRVGLTIRERNQLRRQVQSLSAEGRLSAWVLIALPIAAFAFLMLIQPNYLKGFFEQPLGYVAMGLAVVLMTVGVFWILRVVKVKF
ncbi:MAG: type II secretion system F family protein, partial [Agromyces sp.]